MAASSSSAGSSSSSSSAAAANPIPLSTSASAPSPKILLAKPPSSGSSTSKFAREDDASAAAALRARVAPLGSLNVLVPDVWEFHVDRALPFLTENTDFTVVGVIGPPGVGKSTIMNELYGYDGSTPGMLPPFAMQTDETRATARHCTSGIEIRVSSERLILLDVQPIFSPSVLVDMIKPDGSSSIPVLNGESLSAELAHELMGIQVDMLKHNIPDPSLVTSAHTQNMNIGSGKEWKDTIIAISEEFMASPIFVHTKLRSQELSHPNVLMLKKTLAQYFSSSSFCRNMERSIVPLGSRKEETSDRTTVGPDLVFLPLRVEDEKMQYESYGSALGKLHDRALAHCCSNLVALRLVIEEAPNSAEAVRALAEARRTRRTHSQPQLLLPRSLQTAHWHWLLLSASLPRIGDPDRYYR